MNTTSTKKPFAVYVDDNFHYMDESERYKYGDYATYRGAYAACMKIIDGSLPTTNSNGLSADELYRDYVGFGEDPFIVPVPENRTAFSGWDYAKQRCSEIARLPKQNEDKSPKPSTRDLPKEKKPSKAALEFLDALNSWRPEGWDPNEPPPPPRKRR